MPTNKEYNKYQDDYKRNNYDRMTLLMPKMSKDKIRAIAEKQGLSVNMYINIAIKEKMERDEKTDPVPAEEKAPDRQDTTDEE